LRHFIDLDCLIRQNWVRSGSFINPCRVINLVVFDGGVLPRSPDDSPSKEGEKVPLKSTALVGSSMLLINCPSMQI